jgi:high-affinity iron transporter
MLPTFVIGLREGLEAALIVGIIATFLVQQRRRDALRWMWTGVAVAVALCAGVAVALRVAEQNLPQRQQEGLETIVAVLAVAMVTWMIVWMRQNARGLKHDLEGRAAAALAAGSVGTLVLMAFLAVLREGLETAVFLLAAFQTSTDPATAGTGALLGVVVAIGLGIAIYKGGVRLNLDRFFRLTGLVLVLVAAGLVASAAHTAHEAGWLNSAQGQVMNLTWLVDPGSVRSALLTGMLGIMPRPVVAEVVVWVAYAVPMFAFVLWPARGRSGRRSRATAAALTSAMVAIVTGLAGCGSGGSAPGDAASPAASKRVKVTLVTEGCDPADITVPAGATTFDVRNDGADAINEFEILDGKRIVGEVELVAPGLEKSFSLTLRPGRFTTYCPGGTRDDGKGTLTVTGSATAPNAYDDSGERAAVVTAYRTYLETQVRELQQRTAPFVDAVRAGDVARAKAFYAPARAPYERIEPVAEAFGDLDTRIDARDGDVPASEWGGFHRIEQALWQHGDLAGMTPVADALTADVAKLTDVVRTAGLEPATIANGAVELLDEVTGSKLTGEEERYSHTDLSDVAANVEGSRAAFDAVAPLVSARDAALAAQIRTRFDTLQSALAPYRAGDGYLTYDRLTPDQTRAIAQAVDATAEPLSQVAEHVVAP